MAQDRKLGQEESLGETSQDTGKHQISSPKTSYQAVQSPKGEVVDKSQALANSKPSADAEKPTESGDSKDAEVKKPTKMVSLRELFKYADTYDRLLMITGTIFALIAGLGQPIQIILVGDVLNAFNPTDPAKADDLRSDVNVVASHFAFVAIGMIVAGFVQVFTWSWTASRQSKRIRLAYVQSILTKEIGWFDTNEPGQLASRVADSTVTIQEGMGRKIGDGLHFFSMGFSGIIIGFVKGWDLTLVIIAFMPVIAIAAYLAIRSMTAATQSGIESYGKAGAIAQEALANIRTVHMFNAVPSFVNKYESSLVETTKAGIKKGVAVGWGTGVMFFTMYCTYSAGLYYGSVQVSNDQLGDSPCEGDQCYNGGKVMTIFFVMIMGATALGQSAPSVQAIFAARASAYEVFNVIDKPSEIDPMSDAGSSLEKVEGSIELANVTFAYPSRPDVNVCRDYTLHIAPGETVALVGPSGSGKSTVVSLLERFYDPKAGSVKLDGHNIRDFSVHWLRQQIGLVGQEPSLFATSILENIRYGDPNATDEQVFEAARMANAYDFIADFPNGFDTDVGEKGSQMSGGQKQRIAIARAIIKNPPILLLDEATSALDTESERVVQESLDKLVAETSRTTIVIAHRLSTIRDADRIAVHSEGKIIELGSHEELMQIEGGHYRELVEAQTKGTNRHSSSGPSEDTTDLSLSTSKQEAKLDQEEPTHDVASDIDEEKEKNEKPQVGRIWKLGKPEWKYMVVGSFGAVLNASVFPIWGVILTKIIVLLYDFSKTSEEMRDAARIWCLSFVGLGILFGLSILVQNWGFAVASQRLVTRVRLMTFKAMLHQEVGWFDLEENASGALVSRLASDTAMLQAMTSETLNQGLVNLTTLGIGIGISLYYSWRMALVTIATLPIMLLFGYLTAQIASGTLNNRKNNAADDSAGSLLSEAISSIRTVASLGMENLIRVHYATFLDTSKWIDIKMGIYGGLMFGVAQGALFMLAALLFYLGGMWVADGTVEFENMFVVMMVLILCTFAVGMAAQNMTDGAKAKKAAVNIFKIIDRETNIDPTSEAGKQLEAVQGNLELQNLAFTYPSRPDSKVYSDYTLTVKQGQTVALVGASGSGKSTAISLLERFYDPDAGVVTLDNVDLKELCLPWLRDHISLVSQEPVLFSGTIAENIAMGKPGSTREEVIDAAKKSNAHDFICNFPDGYDTDVGDNGAQVSGGQKQRIAIARAILRDPEVLLLDEATSALDNESERIVQASLDRLLALKRRTTIIVAHRLSTIRNADLIAVTKDGAIVEQGTHDKLMEIEDGVYKALVARQMSSAA